MVLIFISLSYFNLLILTLQKKESTTKRNLGFGVRPVELNLWLKILFTCSFSGGSPCQAWLGGANTVAGPGDNSSSTRPATFTAVTNMENSGLKTSRSRRVQVGLQVPGGTCRCRVGWLAGLGGWGWWGRVRGLTPEKREN